MNSSEDGTVIRESLTRPAAFGQIFDRHAQAVFRYTRWRIGDATAADLTSEVFTVAFRDRSQFKGGESALPWLLGIATNLLRMHHRGEERRIRAYERASALSESGALAQDIDARLDAEAARAVLARGLSALSDRQRDVLLLSAWGELSPAEIASALGVSSGSVRTELHRARGLLSARLAVQAPHLVPDQDLNR